MSKQGHDQDKQQGVPGGTNDSRSPSDASHTSDMKQTSDAKEVPLSTAQKPATTATTTGDGTVDSQGRDEAGKRHSSRRGSGKSGRGKGSGRETAAKPSTSKLADDKSATANLAADESAATRSQSGAPMSNTSTSATTSAASSAASRSGPEVASTASTDSKPEATRTTNNGTKGAAQSGAAASASTPRPGAGGGGAMSGTTASGHRGGGGSGRSITGIVALVLVLILAVAGVVAGWWLWQQMSAQQQRLTQLPQSSQVESNANDIDQLRSRIDQSGEQREEALSKLNQEMNSQMQEYRDSVNQTLDRVLEQLSSQQQTDESEWVYAEVEYLLKLANQRLQLERDVNGAQSLLQTADKRLTEIDNPALTPVRRAIQSELGELNSVPDVDRTGLYLTLMGIQEQLAKLPLQQDIEQIAAKGGDTSQVEGGWQQQLSRFGQELKELVVVRKHEQALEALMTPQQESYLRQNARLQLEQAQLAVLQANPKLYEASLEKARKLIEGYYDPDSDGVKKILEQLPQLSEKTIHPELPDISESLQNLRDFMKRRQDGGSADA
ncbi:uroporphyrinogen-III C-methyltransferase [Halomonas sp. M20]|uniref:uroporphyrinogen-III C-methyltransferase n=1 Tax=Halomonas sp. M20 TaxID=2763264 RepID=UPI001D0A9ABD|nr:uroporphyrinogen-III C-methyltransferase [Halomonas sp. M20]